MAHAVLDGLTEALMSGAVEVVDLAGTLGPNTPLLKLPPELAVDTPAIEIHKISEYDDKGPFWAWNWLKLGEHSGTHFDAPVHWITGKDHENATTDRIPVKNFVAPVCVIDCSGRGGEGCRLPPDRGRREGLGGRARRDSVRFLGRDAHRLAQAQPFGGRVPQHGRERPAFAWPQRRRHQVPHLEGHRRLGRRDDRDGCGARPAAWTRPSQPTTSSTRTTCYGLASLANLDRLPPIGRHPHRSPRLRSRPARAVLCARWRWCRRDSRAEVFGR